MKKRPREMEKEGKCGCDFEDFPVFESGMAILAGAELFLGCDTFHGEVLVQPLLDEHGEGRRG